MDTGHRPSRTVLDALHAELLGTLIDICQKADTMKGELPEIKAEVEEMVSGLRQVFEELRGSSISLVSYVKKKQVETLAEIGKVHADNLTASKQIFKGYDRFLWTLIALGSVNALLLGAVVFGMISRAS